MSSREDFLIRSVHSQPSTYFPPRCNIGKTEVGASITVHNIPPTPFNEWQRYRHILIKRVDLSLRYLVIRYKLECHKNAKGYIEKIKRAEAVRSPLGFPTERLEVEEEEEKREREKGYGRELQDASEAALRLSVVRVHPRKLLLGVILVLPSIVLVRCRWRLECQEWNQERGADHSRDENPCSSAFAKGGCFAKKLKSARDPKKDRFEDDLGELDGGGRGSGVDNSGDDGDRSSLR